MTSIQGQDPNKSKSETLIILCRSGVYAYTLTILRACSMWQIVIATETCWPHVPLPYMLFSPSTAMVSLNHKTLAGASLSSTNAWTNPFININLPIPRLHCSSMCPPTSLWLPPVFSSCRFSPAGTSYFSHSWRGPSSELPGHCRLSAHSLRHTGKN